MALFNTQPDPNQELDARKTNPPTPETTPKKEPFSLFASANASELPAPQPVKDPITELVLQGKLPSDKPNFINGIRSGKIKLNEAMDFYQKVLESKNQDQIVSDYQKAGKLPVDKPNFISKVKSGEINLNDATAFYQQYVAANPTITTNNSTREVNAPDDLKQVSKVQMGENIGDTLAKYNQENNQLSSKLDQELPNFNIRQEAIRRLQERQAGQVQDISPTRKFTTLSDQGVIDTSDIGNALYSFANIGNIVPNLLGTIESISSGRPAAQERAVERQVAQLRKEQSPASTTVGAGARDLALFSGATKLSSALFKRLFPAAADSIIAATEEISQLKKAKTAAKALGNEEELQTLGKALSSARKKNFVLNTVAKGGLENFLTGAVVGGAESLLEHGPTEKALTDGLAEGTLFAATGFLLEPVLGAAGKLVSLRKERRAISGIESLTQVPELQVLSKEIGSPQQYAASTQGISPQTVAEQRAAQVIDKIKNIKPLIGAQAALFSNPEILQAGLQDTARSVSNALFGEAGSLSGLTKVSPALKRMVDTGDHIGALDNAQTILTDQLAGRSDLTDDILAPFVHTPQTLSASSESLKRVNADVLGENAAARFVAAPSLDSPENPLIEQLKLPAKFYETEGKSIRDTRLTPKKIDKVVADTFDAALSKISGKQTLGFDKSLFGNLKHTDEMLNAVTTFNRELSRNFIDSYITNSVAFDSNFVRANPELSDGIKSSINARRIISERNFTVLKRQELSVALDKLKTQYKADANPEFLAQIEAIKDRHRATSKILTEQNSQLREINNAMKGYDPEKKQQISDFVDAVYSPGRAKESYADTLEKQVEQRAQASAIKREAGQPGFEGLKSDLMVRLDAVNNSPDLRSAIESTRAFKEKIAPGENPYFLRKGSELADVMNAFVTGQVDFSDKLGKLFTGFLDNPRRQIAKELGHNNVFEKLIQRKLNLDGVLNQSFKDYNKMIDSIGFEPGSKESALLQRYGEGRLSDTDPEFLKLDPKIQDQLVKGKQTSRDFYDQIIDNINTVMGRNNLPQIRKRDNYFFHFAELGSTLSKDIYEYMKGASPQEKVMFDTKKGFQMYWNPKFNSDPNRTFFSSEKARKGGEFIDDAITGMKAYLKPALERIHYSDLLREVQAARHFAPKNMGNWLEGFANNYLLNAPNEIDKRMTSGAKKAVNAFNSAFAKGAFAFNPNVVLQNILSGTNNFALDPVHATKALLQMGTDEGKAIMKTSANIQIRDAMYLELDKEGLVLKNKYFRGIKKGVDGFNKLGMYGLETFDKLAAGHAFLTGHSKAISMGATPEQAAQFGDRYLEMLHASTSKTGANDLQKTALYRAFFQFSSFVNNFGATIINDLPQIAKSDGATKAVSMIMRGIAGMSLANATAESAGIPKPYDTNLIPFIGSFRFGVSGIVGALGKAVNAGIEEDQSKAAYEKKQALSAATNLLPGGRQLFKGVIEPNLYPKSQKGLSSGDKLRGKIFGSGQLQYEKKMKKEERKNPGTVQKTRLFLRNQYEDLIQ